tara:strand:- start:118 stop:792 length:675 start_codon:yes stop_codon:yes gene_type:complete
MATVDELMVVLDADPTGLEDGMKRAADSTDDFSQQQQAASLATMENLARQEAMVGSLNQVTGGYGKAVGAAQKLGLVNEEQFAALEKSRAAMELIAGPLEVFIALKKFAAAMETTETAAKTANTTATTAATTSTWGFNTALLANPIVLIVVAIVSLVIALVALERKFGVVTATIEALGKMFDKLLDKVDRVKDSFLGVGSVIGDLGDSLISGPVSGVMSLLGGD